MTFQGQDIYSDESFYQNFTYKTNNGFVGYSYTTAGGTIRDTKDRTEKRLTRSQYEMTKAAEKVDRLKRKFEQERKEIELELNEKLAEQQSKIDQDMDVMRRLLQAEIQTQTMRESDIVEFITLLNETVTTKLKAMAKEEQIILEMKEARSKLISGSIASQLDELLAQKRGIIQSDLALVPELNAWIADLESELELGKSRSGHSQLQVTSLGQSRGLYGLRMVCL